MLLSCDTFGRELRHEYGQPNFVLSLLRGPVVRRIHGSFPDRGLVRIGKRLSTPAHVRRNAMAFSKCEHAIRQPLRQLSHGGSGSHGPFYEDPVPISTRPRTIVHTMEQHFDPGGSLLSDLPPSAISFSERTLDSPLSECGSRAAASRGCRVCLAGRPVRSWRGHPRIVTSVVPRDNFARLVHSCYFVISWEDP